MPSKLGIPQLNIFIFGQYFMKLVLEPIFDLKSEIGKLNYLMLFYANKLYSESEDADTVRKEIKNKNPLL